MKHVLITGSNGLVGSRFTMDFSHQYEFDTCDISNPANPVDITDYSQVEKAFAKSSADVVVNLAAFTDVTKAWEQRDDESGPAYVINVIGTANVLKAAQTTGKHLIHISTAYVFDGEKEGLYSENDPINPIEWYGTTKAKAEEALTSTDSGWTILRIDQPFRPDPFPKTDTAHRIINGLLNGSLYPQFTDHYFGPTYLPDFSKVLAWTIENKPNGIYHASSGEIWSDFNFAQEIKNAHKFSTDVKPGILQDYLKTLNRPYQKNTALDCNKLVNAIDFELTAIKDAVKELTW
jgi:dTDP-4-dehydrorhamnose reductase